MAAPDRGCVKTKNTYFRGGAADETTHWIPRRMDCFAALAMASSVYSHSLGRTETNDLAGGGHGSLDAATAGGVGPCGLPRVR